MVDRATTQVRNYINCKPFAILSARAKTTFGGNDPSNDDGPFATKPWCFAHANVGAISEKMVSEHPANLSHEFDLQVLDDGSANVLQIDLQDRGNFITGNTGFNGIKFGSQYDIPLAPIQTLVGLNGANPGGSSGYLPRFAQPIGNSWAHPMLDTSAVVTGGGTYPYLDHLFLLNLALYDHYYFSGLANQSGTFITGGDTKTTSQLLDEFTKGKPLVDPRLSLFTPNGRTAASVSTLAADSSAFQKIASWQVMKGSFNINSTSVGAWKAMLAAIHDKQAIYNKINKTATTGVTVFAALTPADTSKNQRRISRFRLPVSDSEANGADPRDGYWLGPREYSDSQLETLAQKIVEQVKLRGPFLSMSEFVNRRLGSASDPLSQRGALQQAIDDSNLNSGVAAGANAGYNIDPSKVSTYKYKNPEAGAGPSYQGAPRYLTQSDLLAVLGNAATPRSDTFTIRGYGEARNASNGIIAAATCEAVVQRIPDYVDPADAAEVVPASLTSTANKTFGRRFRIVSFRWLNSNEI